MFGIARAQPWQCTSACVSGIGLKGLKGQRTLEQLLAPRNFGVFSRWMNPEPTVTSLLNGHGSCSTTVSTLRCIACHLFRKKRPHVIWSVWHEAAKSSPIALTGRRA